jgi:tetratricopeptide (TPR) repeat protein
LLALDEAASYIGRYSEAIQYSTEAISIDPENYDAYWDRAIRYRDLKDYARSIEDLSAALSCAKPPNDQLIYPDRAETFEKMGRYQNAIADYSRCLASEDLSVVKPSSGLAEVLRAHRHRLYICRGDDYQKLHRSQEAIADYSRAIECLKDSPSKELMDVYEKRAKSYIALGNFNLAAADKLSAHEAAAHDIKKRKVPVL